MRATVLVIDSFGIGALPDADSYGDEGSNTAGHIAGAIDGEIWPNLRGLGLGNAAALLGSTLAGCEPVDRPDARFGVMAETSPGKDTTTGHWELMGVVLDRAFHTFPKEEPSFPAELLDAFTDRIGRGVLGNCAASGTVIIQDLGDEHVSTGKPILYTSSDSVFQIAAHEEVIPVDELYRMCEIARELCDPYRVGRVIARPFVGSTGNYTRTSGRRDFSMEPAEETLLDRFTSRGIETIGVGKIGDIFVERGIDVSHHDKGNEACLARTLEILQGGADDTSNGADPGTASGAEDSFVFVNLVDTDMIYGHRRDVQGYADAVSAIDAAIPEMRRLLTPGDVLVITADHGCDPTFHGTDHTREYVPMLWYQEGAAGGSVGIRSSFADLAQSLCERYDAGRMEHGTSFVS